MTTPSVPALLRQATAAVAGKQQYPAGTLYLVATPIGNLADITLRAIHVLALVDAVACEDTRHSAPLLRALGIDTKPLLALHAHNEQAASAGVLERLARGERVAFISDAGTPAVSDPGAVLVAAASSAGYRCIPVPGASSATAALSVAGDVASAGFTVVGFLPSRGNARAQALQAVAAAPPTQLLFEAPHRIEALARDLALACGERRLTLCRELTKQFETVTTMDAAAAPGWLAADPNRLRGEFVLVLHALTLQHGADDSAVHDRLLAVLLAELPLKQAVAVAAKLSGAPRNALYGRALELKGSSG
jgi:16S rRNA (cytidine1402-2'-O)-methyltransferase